MVLIETPEGFALVDGMLTVKTDDAVAYELGDYPQVGKISSSGKGYCSDCISLRISAVHDLALLHM